MTQSRCPYCPAAVQFQTFVAGCLLLDSRSWSTQPLPRLRFLALDLWHEPLPGTEQVGLQTGARGLTLLRAGPTNAGAEISFISKPVEAAAKPVNPFARKPRVQRTPVSSMCHSRVARRAHRLLCREIAAARAGHCAVAVCRAFDFPSADCRAERWSVAMHSTLGSCGVLILGDCRDAGASR